MARQDNEYKIETPGGSPLKEKAPSGEVALSRLLSRVTANGAPDGEYRIFEMPPLSTGVTELLYRVTREGKPDGRFAGLTIVTVNE